ncbi:MAG TPA: hypothetical protein VIE65_00035 [Methylobacter sp.]|jgi:hypothetical protein
MSAERNFKKPPKQQKITLPYFIPPNLRAVPADGAVITAKFDPIGTSFQINFTRADFTPVTETFDVIPLEGGIMQGGIPSYDMPPRKVVEAIVVIRPDHAFQIASAILLNLNNLAPAVKQRYQIPELNLVSDMPGAVS